MNLFSVFQGNNMPFLYSADAKAFRALADGPAPISQNMKPTKKATGFGSSKRAAKIEKSVTPLTPAAAASGGASIAGFDVFDQALRIAAEAVNTGEHS
jgi:hypothetical protein